MSVLKENGREENHYEFIERAGKFLKFALGLSYNPNDLSVSHGDKCYGYRVEWEEAGIDFKIGALFYLLTYMDPYRVLVRKTENGWVDTGDWVISFYKKEENKVLVETLNKISKNILLSGFEDMNKQERITFIRAMSTGYSENHLGIGTMDISLQREGKYPWLDLGVINYQRSTPDQILDMETAPFGSEENKNKSNVHRRLSFIQANYINRLICDMLEERLQGDIPSDEEILEIQKKKPIDF